MRIILSTVGSTGDIQPFLALGKKLLARNHDVLAISHVFHEARFAQHGIPFQGCGPDISQDDINQHLDKVLDAWSPLKQIRVLMEQGVEASGEGYFRDALRAMKGADLALCHMIDFLGHEAALQLGIPRIGTIFAPSGIPTRFASPLFAPDLGRLNPIWWKLMTATMRPLDNKVRANLARVGGTQQDIQRFYSLAPEMNLIAASPMLAPTYPDLPERFRVTGPWILPEPEYEPDDALRNFLEKYPRPVIVSFGSMGGSKGPQLTSAILKALDLLDQPAIIQSGYAKLFREDVPDRIHFAGYVPHGWLFERGACVVHHGGAGTTTAVCRAGVPSVVVPFFADQPYFANGIRQLGLGPKMLPFRRLSPSRLAIRIREAANSPAMQHRAKELRPLFLQEEGSDRAVRYIEEFARQKGFL